VCGGAYGASTHFAADPWSISGRDHRSASFRRLRLPGKAGVGYAIAGDAALQDVVGAGLADRRLTLSSDFAAISAITMRSGRRSGKVARVALGCGDGLISAALSVVVTSSRAAVSVPELGLSRA
jgi:hypothetical protein